MTKTLILALIGMGSLFFVLSWGNRPAKRHRQWEPWFKKGDLDRISTIPRLYKQG
jgi:hypothetical protein